jgi:hypothetical protein
LPFVPSPAAWVAGASGRRCPEAAKSEGDFMCANNAKILFSKIEMHNTFFDLDIKVFCLSGVNAIRKWA